ncbi:unnamed protein product [Kuraishia capsulata CBS 1993]|uniref:Uncharacterized protein n=1 Tax=Kuraishia capsulata CBS 1993 TaxID=1382522 RepID=W6MHF1_9ASCO|nr:unnamed protein product [Kuraishia capsulata CBS 1993]
MSDTGSRCRQPA